MSTAITIESLGKKYLISHEIQKRSFTTFREQITHRCRQLGNTFRQTQSFKNMTQEDFWALDDVSFEVQQGERVAIIGRNGAGKSTLLKILSRITEPTKGRITLEGRLTSLLEVGTGFHPELTGRENIFLNGIILGMTTRDIRKRFDQIVDFAEISKFLDTPVKRYSSGMYLRLAFSVAAHLEPEILIVDEVLAVGDLLFQKKCLGRMSDIGNEGTTVLFVSHSLSAVSQLCKRAVLLQQGKLVMDDATPEVINHYTASTEDDFIPVRYYDHFPKDGLAAIRRISVKNEGKDVSSDLDMDKNIEIEVDYEIITKCRALIVGISISSAENNQPVISISDPELNPSRLEGRNPGIYTARVLIPHTLLNSGTYRIRVGIVRDKRILDVKEDISFNLHDRIGIMTVIGYERKNSILSLQLPWTVTKN